MSVMESLKNPWVIAGMFVLVIGAILWLKRKEKPESDKLDDNKKDQCEGDEDGKRRRHRHRDRRRFDTSLFEIYTDSWLKAKKRNFGDVMPYDFFDPNSGEWQTRHFVYTDDETFGMMLNQTADQFEQFWADYHNEGPTGHNDFVSVSGGVESCCRGDHNNPCYVVIEKHLYNGKCETHFVNLGAFLDVEPFRVIKFPGTAEEVVKFFKEHQKEFKTPETGMGFGEAAVQGAGFAFGANIVNIALDLFTLRRQPMKQYEGKVEATQRSLGYCYNERLDPGCQRRNTCKFNHVGAEDYFRKLPCNNPRCAIRRQDNCRMVHSTAAKTGKWSPKASSKKQESMIVGKNYLTESDFEEVKKAFGIVEYSYLDSQKQVKNMKAQCFHARDKMQIMFHDHEIPTLVSAHVKFHRVGFERDLTKKEIDSIQNLDDKEVKICIRGCLSTIFAVHPRSSVRIPQVRMGPVPSIGASIWGWSMGNQSEEEHYFAHGKVQDVKDDILFHNLPTDRGNCGMAIMQGKYVVADHLLGGVKAGERNEALLVQHFRLSL
jgi:hypothetical protein